MKGGSGATLRPAVVKFGDGEVGARVGKQGEWLAAHQHIPSLPRVFGVWSHGYTMEPLRPIEPSYESQYVETLSVLRQDFWSRPAEADLDLDRHLRFVRSRCDAFFPEVWEDLEEWCGKIEWPAPVLIHGDPTFSNQCRRENGELVLCDPNPASDRVPSVRAEDIANLCQSMLGYEAIKFRWPLAKPFMMPGGDEADLIRYLTAVKFVRILAYEPRTEKFMRFRDIAARLIASR